MIRPMFRKPVFDAIRRLLGRGLRQREVAAIDAALDAGEAAAAAPARRIGPEGIALIQRFEGCERRIPGGLVEAYPDPGSSRSRTGSGSGAPWTIGWGATGPGIGPGTVWTQAQFDALVGFHYNTGAIRRATLTRKHVAGDHAGAAAEFARWNRAGGRVLSGLTRRRAAEAALYREGN